MANLLNSTVSIEVKLDQETKDALNKIPDNMQERLYEIERVLIEICERQGIAFSLPER